MDKTKLDVPPQAPKKSFNKNAVIGVGGLCLVVLVTIGVLVGALSTQKTYNGSGDILRAMETADGIAITLITTGMYADDGFFQQTNILIRPKDFSKHKTEVVFDAKAEFQRDNTTVTYILKDSKAYTMETNNTSGEIRSYCSNVPEMPHLDGIVDTILNGQVVEHDNAFHHKLQCPQDSHRLIHAVWEGLDYFYCFDTSGTELGSFLGPAMVGKVEYLSKEKAASITIQAPQDLNCDAIDLSSLSQNPIKALNLQESRRRLREMAKKSCNEQVRLGRCEFCYSELSQGDAFSGIKPWGLIISSFAKLKLDFSPFTDLVQLPSTSISIRRRLKHETQEIYRFEHDGMPCIFIHGAGVKVKKK